MNTGLAIVAFISIIAACIAVVAADAWDDIKSFYEDIFHRYF